MTSAPRADGAAVLHSLRVKGAATTSDVTRISAVEDPAGVLAMLLADGLAARHVAGEREFFTLTAAGADSDARAMLALSAGSEALANLYDERFLALNTRFKELCASWQQQGESIELIEQAEEIHEALDGLLAVAAMHAPHLERYRVRLGASIEAFLDGDASALMAPVGDSYHNTWFELHEDLIATLGRTRAEEGEQ
jgi:hypothetical protein